MNGSTIRFLSVMVALPQIPSITSIQRSGGERLTPQPYRVLVTLLAVSQHDRVTKQPHFVRDPECLSDLRAMEFDGSRADAQHLSDLAAALALTDQTQDLPLTRCETVE
jgi:hypothetical protein